MIAVIGKVPSKALKVLVLLLPVIACDSTDVIGSTNPVTINAYPVLIKAYPDWGFGTSVTHIGEGKFLVGEVGSLHVYEA